MDNTAAQPNQTPSVPQETTPVSQTPPTVPVDQTVGAAIVTPSSGGNKKMFVILGVVVILILGLAGATFFMMQHKPSTSQEAMNTQPTTAPTATPMPTKTEVEEVDAVDTNEDMTSDFTDVQKDVSSL